MKKMQLLQLYTCIVDAAYDGLVKIGNEQLYEENIQKTQTFVLFQRKLGQSLAMQLEDKGNY